MPITQAPSVEAMAAIVTRINTATTYTLPTAATRNDAFVESLDNISSMRVEVVQEEESQVNDTLDTEDRSQHVLRIVIRKKISRDGSNNLDQSEIDSARLVTRQIWQRVNNYDSSDQRVKVWEADFDPKEVPVRSALVQHGVFAASILIRVEVKASI